MIYSVLQQDYFYENFKFKTIDKGGVKLTVLDLGNGEGEIFNVISSNPRDYLRNEYAPGKKIKLEGV